MAGTETQKIRVVVVDDSAAFRRALVIALQSDRELEVVGEAADGQEAVELIERLQPDVVTMDVVMPVLDGLEAAKRILAKKPVPIVLMSTLARSEEQRMALNAMRLGVVDVTSKPVLAGAGGPAGIAQVVRLVKAAANIHVPRRPRSGVFVRPPELDASAGAAGQRHVQLIAVAASTGGPPVLERVLGDLPADCPPVVVAQHLAPSFSRGFAEWLSGSLKRAVVTVTFREVLSPGTIYIAGEHQHVRVERGGVVEPEAAQPGELAPRADVLFRSAAEAYGAGGVGVVLTGMGNDGAAGLKAMRDAGAWTIGQDRETSVVYGMPRVAFEAGACCEVLSSVALGARLAALVGKGRS